MSLISKLAIAVSALMILLVLPSAGSVEVVTPEYVGFSSERLQAIPRLIQRHIASGSMSGAITLVARKGRVAHFQTHGLMDVAAKTPMAADAIFRIASMTKPVVAVAVMMMVEEGKVRLNDPVSRFIPGFKTQTVAVGDAPTSETSTDPIRFHTVPANREITVRDLLTHVSGLASGPISTQEAAVIVRGSTETLAEYIPRLAAIPLELSPPVRTHLPLFADVLDDTIARCLPWGFCK